MGSSCTRGAKESEKGGNSNKDKKRAKKSKTKTVQPSPVPQPTADIHPSADILDDDFQDEITDAIQEHVATVAHRYQTERDRIVNEMRRAAPDRYLGLFYSEYPNINGLTVNEMAKRMVASKQIKNQLIDQIEEETKSSFQSRTANWKSTDRESARSEVRAFIEQVVNQEFNRIRFD